MVLDESVLSRLVGLFLISYLVRTSLLESWKI